MSALKAATRRSVLSEFVLARKPDFYETLPPMRVKHVPQALARCARKLWEADYGESPEAYLAANRDEQNWLRSRWIASEIVACDPCEPTRSAQAGSIRADLLLGIAFGVMVMVAICLLSGCAAIADSHAGHGDDSARPAPPPPRPMKLPRLAPRPRPKQPQEGGAK